MMSYGYKLYQHVLGQELDRLENYSDLEKNIETLLKNEGKILKLFMKVPCLRNAFCLCSEINKVYDRIRKS